MNKILLSITKLPTSDYDILLPVQLINRLVKGLKLPRIRSLDLVTMKALDKKCNIIPIIAKSDTVSKSELDSFKANVSI